MNRGRVTRRGRIVLVVVVVLVAGAGFVGYRILVGGHDCEATIGGTTVQLERAEAEQAAVAVAALTRRCTRPALDAVDLCPLALDRNDRGVGGGRSRTPALGRV